MKKSNSEKKPIKAQLAMILSLFWTFFKLGAFTFGGGYAMIALIEKDVVERKKWISDKEMLDIVAIAESTPGAIALNTATFIGAKMAGFWGSLFASIAVMLPSIAIIIAISAVIEKFGSNQYVKWAFLGIRASVSALILNAVFKMFKAVKPSIFSYAIMAASFVLALLSALNIIPVNVIFIIIASAIIGIIYGFVGRKIAAKKQKNSPSQNQNALPTNQNEVTNIDDVSSNEAPKQCDKATQTTDKEEIDK